LTRTGDTIDGYTRAVFDRYLDLLGVRRTEPDPEALAELTAHHLRRVPFENVSKIYRVKNLGIRAIPPPEEYLDGIERYNFGGTCYTNNYYMHLLLAHLGYSVRLCGADVGFSGAPLDNHMVNVVAIGGHEFVVDVGYGAPFLRPLPRDKTTDVVLDYGPNKYILKPVDPEGRSRLEVYQDGQVVHGYLLKPAARRVDYFSEVVARSYTDTASFLNRLMVAHFVDDSHYVMRNDTLTISTPDSSQKRQFESRQDITEAVVRHYGMPPDIVREVINQISESNLFGR